MDNIIKYLNFEDEGLKVLDQRVEKGKRILTVQKKLVSHFCHVCSCRIHSKGISPRTINHPVMQDSLQLILIVNQRRWQCTNAACKNIITDEFSFVERYKRNTKLADILIVDAFKDPNMTAAQIARNFSVSDTYALTTFSKYVDIHRRQEKTEPYFTAIPAAGGNRVRYLVSDMYRPYITYVDKYFPNAISVVDSFHVVKHINHQIQLYMSALARRIRSLDLERHYERELSSHRKIKFIPSREYILVKHYQWIILMNQSELNYSAPPFYRTRLGFYADIHKLEYLLFYCD